MLGNIPKKTIIAVVVIFLLGFASFGGVNTFFHYTNEMEFCTSCHSMKFNFEEYSETVHYKNGSGVQATCADCHVPKSFFPKVAAKIMAAKDVYHWILGTVNTREKFEAHRWDMASRVWAKMEASDSRECRSCHDFDNMDLSAQDRIARKKHPRAQMKGQTCIDCHKGIAHLEPDEPDDEDGDDNDDEDPDEDADKDTDEEEKDGSEGEEKDE
jgi:cytochrome c-type protein NapC